MLSPYEGLRIATKYQLFHPIAKGGMGSVWIAKHIALDVPVAIKFMDPRYADYEDLRARFEREARAAAQLRMPNVVQILDYGIEEDTPYIVMEFLRGEDLGTRLAREGRLSVHDTVTILLQVCKALRRAHEEGIIHRDLKPANVFLVIQEDELLVKVLDFGIAKVLRSDTKGDTTKTGDVMGSPAYMSPEQIRGLKEIDLRTDLWSLGVLAYRALTGTLPFPGENSGDMFVKICTEEPILPTKHAPDLDARVDAFMAKALAKNPALRFSSAKVLAEALAALDDPRPSRSTFESTPFATAVDGATNSPVTSNPSPTRRRRQKSVRIWAFSIGSTMILAAIGFAYWIIQLSTALDVTSKTPVSEFSGAGDNLPAPQVDNSHPDAAPLTIAQPAVSATPITENSTPNTRSSRKQPTAPASKPSANLSIRKEM